MKIDTNPGILGWTRRAHAAMFRARAAIVVSGGLQNKQTGQIYKSALEVTVANDRIAPRSSQASTPTVKPLA